MADERTDEMTPSAIEREIARALAVDPSPEFVARVRMRIASEPPPRRTWWMPVLVGATAIAAAVTIVLVAPWRGAQVQLKKAADPQVRLKPDTTPERATEGVGSGFSRTRTSPGETQIRLKPDATEAVAPIRGVGSGFSRTSRTPKTTDDVRPAEPELLVSREESDALRRLLARASQHPIVVDTLVLDAADPVDLAPPEIAIEPIKIEPLVPQTNGEGVRQ